MFEKVKEGSLLEGNVRWFLGGKLNASVQCLDRHIAQGKGDKVALIWEADEPGNSQKFTFKQVLAETCKIANVMKSYGIKKGDPVTIYMPMVPQLAFVMLACTRIGAPHSVVFAGFSAEALKERIIDVNSRFVFTCDEGKRGGKTIALKKCVDDSIKSAECSFVERVFVFKRTGNSEVPFQKSKDVWIEEEMKKQRPYCPPETMDSEDILFFLYTSGSTGKPKGVVHTTAGYMLYVTLTHKYTFDLREGDVYACVADCGWITGHSYIVYGPLSNCTTSLMFESTPLYPNCERYWDLIDTHGVTQFYTAPTAIRALMRHGTDAFKNYKLTSLRILGTVGEPINPEAWKWYFENVGLSRCSIVDTYWQTENGGFLLTPMPGATPLKPGSATFPFLGILPAVLDAKTGKEIPFIGEETEGVLCIKKAWPSLARTVHNNHERYLNTYLTPYEGYYFTGDGCIRDKDGYFWVTGRVDDVLNVSGHRIGSAELESALVGYDAVAEAAIVGIPHEIKGQGIAVYVILKAKYNELLIQSLENKQEIEDLKLLRTRLVKQVRQVIGPFATPDLIIFTRGLPKTRSGKIMRRVLRKIIQNEALGDVSTMADSTIVDELKIRVEMAKSLKK